MSSFLCFLLMLVACSGSSPAPEPTPTAEPEVHGLQTDTDPSRSPTVSFAATVHIVDSPAGKRLQAVTLLREDGQSWIVSYRKTPLWAPYKDQKVTVSGYVDEPTGQAVMSTYFTVQTLKVDDQMSGVDPVGFGPMDKYSGTFSTVRGDEGSKSAGASWRVLKAGGMTYELMNPSLVTAEDGVATTVQGRVVERSPVSAHRGGLTLLIIE